jgi:hypothetical protein
MAGRGKKVDDASSESGPAGDWGKRPVTRSGQATPGQTPSPLGSKQPEQSELLTAMQGLMAKLAEMQAAQDKQSKIIEELQREKLERENGTDTKPIQVEQDKPKVELPVQARVAEVSPVGVRVDEVVAMPIPVGIAVESPPLPTPLEQPSEIRETSRNHYAVIRPEAPKAFSGRTNELEDWLDAVEIYFALYGLQDDRTKYLVIQQFLSQDVRNWVKTLGLECWASLRKEMVEYYSDPLEKERAWTALNKIQQTGSVKEYTEKFLQLVVKVGTGVTQTDRMRRYVEGLKDDVRVTIRIGMIEGRYTSFNQIKGAAEALDFELWRNKRPVAPTRTPSSGSPYRGPSGFRSGASGSGSGSPTKRFPPRVNAFRNNHALSKEETAKRYEQRLCYNCGRPGHVARRCPENGRQEKQISRLPKSKEKGMGRVMSIAQS